MADFDNSNGGPKAEGTKVSPVRRSSLAGSALGFGESRERAVRVEVKEPEADVVEASKVPVEPKPAGNSTDVSRQVANILRAHKGQDSVEAEIARVQQLEQVERIRTEIGDDGLTAHAEQQTAELKKTLISKPSMADIRSEFQLLKIGRLAAERIDQRLRAKAA